VKTSEEAYEKDQWVETQYATYRPLAPTFDLNDIAHSLAQVNRYNGHGRFPFSVATHSVLVSLLMEEVTGGDPFEGLYHDGTEAYLADVAAPIKPLLPDWKALDGKAELLLRKQLGLPEKKTKECKAADWLALFIEAYQLMPSKAANWEDPENLRPVALRLRKQGWKISEIDWRYSRRIFVERHNAIRPVNIPALEV
jgi:hypothetical protein